ncbi:zinc ribbon domain-containing protein [Halolamina rubra]|uniref:zinc ribbon domain-containing protein n=1 Tax=Halolamina rubra TaxID=1380430 RepID=UPI00067947E7|nr:zinc ribbon domain-containing protein [Halolamina rubra]
MSLVPERLRPYLAGLLGTLATGFGHLYLRRWLRGFGWIALAFAATIAFVPEGTLQTISAGEAVADQADLYPAMIIQLVGAVDAFVLAYRETSGGVDPDVDVPIVSDAESDTVSCPNCGKEVDADLEFCHWCTTEFAAADSDSA